MNRDEAEKRIIELKKIIRKFDREYYIHSAPLIPDYEYDMLYSELKQLEEEFPDLITKDSPTQHVSEDVIKGFEKMSHNPRMYSLDNTYSDEDLLEFIDRIKRETGNEGNYLIQPKIDGVAVSLMFRKGYFDTAISRGNGSIGDNITDNIRTIKELPDFMEEMADIDELIIRGEVFFTKERFSQLAEIHDFANARNAASGTLKLHSSDEVGKRMLSIRIHSVITGIKDTEKETEELLAEAGLPIVEMNKVIENIDDVIDEKNSWESKRHQLPYETDGIVIKINQFALRDKMGFTNKAPRWAFAFKYKPENAVTRIISIDYQVGRTGVITPVANLEPVHLSGTMVKRATLHNFDEIERLGISVNDYVEVEKSGEIIPKIIKKADIKENKFKRIDIKKPVKCPSCGQGLVSYDNEVAVRCININCPAQIERSIVHFVSKGGMDVENMGPSIVTQMINKGLINSMSDIFALNENDLVKLERMGEKSTDNLITSIDNAKTVQMSKFLYALGIRNIGEYLSKILSDNYQSIELLMESRMEDLVNIEGIGEEAANSIEIFFSNENNRREISKLLNMGINIVNSRISNKLGGMKFVVTGTLKNFSRESIKRSITDNGGIVLSSVTRETDYLIAGEKAGSKVKKAKDMNIEIIDEKAYKKMLEK